MIYDLMIYWCFCYNEHRFFDFMSTSIRAACMLQKMWNSAPWRSHDHGRWVMIVISLFLATPPVDDASRFILTGLVFGHAPYRWRATVHFNRCERGSFTGQHFGSRWNWCGNRYRLRSDRPENSSVYRQCKQPRIKPHSDTPQIKHNNHA